MRLEFDSRILFNEFDTCSGMSTDELISDLGDIMLSAPDALEILQYIDEHEIAVIVLLALRQYTESSALET